MTHNHTPLNTPLFCREAGSGTGVVCIHCNGSSSSHWRPLMDLLAPRHLVLAPDTHGAGRGPAWPTDRPLTLRDEVALLEPVFARAGAADAGQRYQSLGACRQHLALARAAQARDTDLRWPGPHGAHHALALVDAAIEDFLNRHAVAG